MMGNLQQQDIPGLSQLSPSGTQTATQAAKRKRQLPFSLTQAAAAILTAIDAAQTSPGKSPAAPQSHAAAAGAAVSDDLATVADGTMAPPSKCRRRPKVQPPPAGTAESADDSRAAGPSQTTAAADQQQSRLHVEQQVLKGVPATADLCTQHATRSSKRADPSSRSSKVLLQNVKVADLDASSWKWMLTAEQMLAVSDEELLQQCRHCLAVADGLQQVQAADADRPKQLQSFMSKQLQQQKYGQAGKALATAASTAGGHVKLGMVGAQSRQELQLRLQPNLPAQQQPGQNYYQQQQSSVPSSFQGAAVPTAPPEVAASAAIAAPANVIGPEQQHTVQPTVATLPLGAAGTGLAAAAAVAAAAAAVRAGDGRAAASHAAPRRGLASIRSRLLDED